MAGHDVGAAEVHRRAAEPFRVPTFGATCGVLKQVTLGADVHVNSRGYSLVATCLRSVLHMACSQA